MRRTVLLPFLLLLLAGCGASVVAPSPLNVQIIIPLGQTVTVPGAAAALRFVAVTEDSRCPATVQCVWAGLAATDLAFTADGVETRLQLKTDPVAARAATVDRFRIELIGLSPLPMEGRSDPLPYEITVRVARP